MADTYLSPAQDARDDEETLGLWGRVGVYSAGVATAMAIFYWGAVPPFRDALRHRGNGVQADAAVSAAASGDDLLGRVRDAVAAEDGLGRVQAGAAGDVIILQGRVASDADRLRSETVASAVRGVARVDNRLVVDPSIGGDATANAAGATASTSPAVAATGAAERTPSTAAAVPNTVVITTAAPAVTAPATTAPATTAPATTATTVAPAPPTTVATDGSDSTGNGAANAAATADTTTPTTVPAIVVADVQARLDALMALEPILFESSSPSIRPESYETLDRLAALLAEAPSTRIEIQGHTDDVGPAESNLYLSQDRAGRVLAELALRGVAFERMTATGYGQNVPVVPNDSEANRQLNRRIHFVLS